MPAFDLSTHSFEFRWEGNALVDREGYWDQMHFFVPLIGGNPLVCQCGETMREHNDDYSSSCVSCNTQIAHLPVAPGAPATNK